MFISAGILLPIFKFLQDQYLQYFVTVLLKFISLQLIFKYYLYLYLSIYNSSNRDYICLLTYNSLKANNKLELYYKLPPNYYLCSYFFIYIYLFVILCIYKCIICLQLSIYNVLFLGKKKMNYIQHFHSYDSVL